MAQDGVDRVHPRLVGVSSCIGPGSCSVGSVVKRALSSSSKAETPAWYSICMLTKEAGLHICSQGPSSEVYKLQPILFHLLVPQSREAWGGFRNLTDARTQHIEISRSKISMSRKFEGIFRVSSTSSVQFPPLPKWGSRSRATAERLLSRAITPFKAPSYRLGFPHCHADTDHREVRKEGKNKSPH